MKILYNYFFVLILIFLNFRGDYDISNDTSKFNFKSLNNSENKYGWYGGSLLHFSFGENQTNFLFSISSGARFKSDFLEDKIIVYWNKDSIDVPLKKYLVQKFKGIEEYPEDNMPFCELFGNKQKIEVKYEYEKWVKKVNNIGKETYFPQILKLKSYK